MVRKATVQYLCALINHDLIPQLNITTLYDDFVNCFVSTEFDAKLQELGITLPGPLNHAEKACVENVFLDLSTWLLAFHSSRWFVLLVLEILSKFGAVPLDDLCLYRGGLAGRPQLLLRRYLWSILLLLSVIVNRTTDLTSLPWTSVSAFVSSSPTPPTPRTATLIVSDKFLKYATDSLNHLLDLG